MIPVLRKATFSDLILSLFAVNSTTSSASNLPALPTPAFAIPLLTVTACTFPFKTLSLDTLVEGEMTLLVVKTPAETHGRSA